MTILSDGELREAMECGEIVFDPAIDLETQLQPASIDLRLGSSFARFMEPLSPQDAIIPGKTNIESMMEQVEAKRHVFAPGEFWLAATLERVYVGTSLVARVEGRSSFGRLGLTVHSTAGFVDPGFDGQITLEMTNEGAYPVMLFSGTRVCQLVFERLGREAEKPYGVKEGAKYQGQVGATASRIRDRG